MTVRIHLVGHGGFYNRGCEAIVRGTVEIVKRYIPNSEISLSSLSPEADSRLVKLKGIEIEKVVSAIHGKKKPSLGWLWQTVDRRILSFNMPFYDYIQRPYYRDSDIVMSIGGDNFTDDYSGPDGHFRSIVNAKKAGAKTVMWGASIGPFKRLKKAEK